MITKVVFPGRGLSTALRMCWPLRFPQMWCAVLVGCHSAFHLHKTWFFRHSQECGACKFAECLRLLSLFTLYVYLWFSQILWDPKYYCLAFVVRRSLSFVNDRLELAWREWPYIRSVQNLKRCQAHFLLKVFGEGYEVNHWELDDEVKLFSRSLVSDSLPPRGLQHTRFPCPTPTPGVYSNSCPLSRWCHPTIIPCRSLLLLPSVFPSIRIFSNESALRIRWPKYWNFSFNISPSGYLNYSLSLPAQYTFLKKYFCQTHRFENKHMVTKGEE